MIENPGAWIKATMPLPPASPRKYREPKWSKGDRRLLKYLEEHPHRKQWISARGMARWAGTSVSKVIGELRGQPFTLDFGHDRFGRRLVFFYTVELRNWLKAQTRGRA